MIINEKEIVQLAVSKLEMVLSELKTCELQEKEKYIIKSNELFKDTAKSQLLTNFNYDKDRYVYLIRYLATEDTSDKIKKAFEDFSSKNTPKIKGITFNLPRYNEEHTSKYLYVGTSKKLKNRIKQHLGLSSSKQTYSLHLIYWFPKQIDLGITIIKVSSENKMVFESIEQAYWDNYEPLFGKRSGL
ncbi:GIY-YIG nuclease family protein [Xanthomarina gelatinilytica]|uniref:GIY-YIG nuclease family protein n=1 Tax=Xanthomarina gelatinilytica TaxID=1137281 RepID=UPI003AA8BF54